MDSLAICWVFTEQIPCNMSRLLERSSQVFSIGVKCYGPYTAVMTRMYGLLSAGGASDCRCSLQSEVMTALALTMTMTAWQGHHLSHPFPLHFIRSL